MNKYIYTFLGIHLRRKPLPHVSSCLYQMFKCTDAPLHSLQFIPIYQAMSIQSDDDDKTEEGVTTAPSVSSSGEHPSPSLRSLCLFVSSGREGYLYQVKPEVVLLATYAYTGECSKVRNKTHFIS